ncbi:hypothetical protein FHS18_002771 [Paenibacillus phyllosphaerae]|uniref:Uncharacterized protein n=1 Tax=Paenibacillus phyllosphaerae TaxID=274593 RepID=A0A7W5AXQ2_9BACL|nr:hypothetical protein [Paenibacillus phyllosphaerae]MBB3110704.1 hypothetical protein [Paenibacillus phyllosphaerae]
MSQWNRNSSSQQANGRLLQLIIGGIIFIIIIGIISQSCSNSSTMLSSDTVSFDGTGASDASTASGSATSSADQLTVPWDYQVTEGKVGELVAGDMTVLPNNKLLPNDGNYKTGDTIWVIEYMSALMESDDSGKTNVTLTAWQPIKSFKTEALAKADLDKLKFQVKSEVDLVGVYKTTYQGATRQFAVLVLPSGNRLKQPIDEAKYNELKSAKKANVLLEEVHSYQNYDLAYAKFRGWAS